MDSLLFERDDEMAVLEGAASGAADGSGQFVIVEAGAGIGKTRLLAEARQRLESGGMATAVATAREIDHDLPFEIVRDLLSPLIHGDDTETVFAGAAGMSRPVFEPVEGEPADLADRLHGLYWLVSDLSESQPLALLIDDAHWADEQSLRWINHLAARIRDVPVLLIVATRPREKSTSALLSPSHDALAVTRLQLGPLSDESVAAMVETGLGQEPTPAFLAACMQATGGNPYLANELTRALAAAGVTPDDRESGRLAEFSPDSIRSTLARRIADEGEQAVAVARALAVLGDGSSCDRIYELAEVEPAAGAEVLDRLNRKELILAGANPRFVHAMVRDAVTSEIGPSQLVLLHRRAVEIGTAASDSADLLAPHLLVADPADRVEGIRILEEAANIAEVRGAPKTATEFLDRAFGLAGSISGFDRRPLALARARAHSRANSPSAAALLLAEVAVVDDPHLSVLLRLEAAHAMFGAGMVADGTDLLEATLSMAQTVDPDLALTVEAALIAGLMLIPSSSNSVQFRGPVDTDRYKGETRGQRAILAARAAYLAVTIEGTADQAVELARAAWADGTLLEDDGHSGLNWSLVTAALASADHYVEGEAVATRTLEAAQAAGSRHTFATASYCRGCALLFRSSIDEAVADAEAAIAAREDGWELYLPLSLALAAKGYLELGDRDAAARTLRLSPGESFREDSLAGVALNLARCELALVDGDVDGAHRLMQLTQETASGYRFPFALSDVLTVAAAIERRRGNHAAAVDLFEEQLDSLSDWGAPRLIGVSLTGIGLIVRGRKGLERTGEAVERLRGSEVRLGYGYALHAHGTLLREQGFGEDAEAALREALEIAADGGSKRLEAAAREELALLGRRPRRIKRSGVGALTASERRVASRAAAGLTNREIGQELFVSVKTVEKHLANAYAKLGIASRRQLDGMFRLDD